MKIHLPNCDQKADITRRFNPLSVLRSICSYQLERMHTIYTVQSGRMTIHDSSESASLVTSVKILTSDDTWL